jgi:hypothetical protein
VDNAHAIESIVLETEDILQPNNLEVMAMAKNKETEHRRLAQKGLPILVQEDPYMIHLLGQQTYIDIVKLVTIRWLEGANLPFYFIFFLLIVCWNVVTWRYCFIVGEIQVHSILKNPDSPTMTYPGLIHSKCNIK